MENWYQNFLTASSAIDSIDDFSLYKDPWVQVVSSFIDAVAYFETAKVLEIKMKNGKRYPFFGVPKDVYEAFLAAPSKGNFFTKVIRQNYSSS